MYDARRVGSGVRGRGWVVRGLGSTSVRTKCFWSNLKYLEEEGDADWLERAARDEAPCPCDVLRGLCRECHHPNQELCGDDRRRMDEDEQPKKRRALRGLQSLRKVKQSLDLEQDLKRLRGCSSAADPGTCVRPSCWRVGSRARRSTRQPHLWSRGRCSTSSPPSAAARCNSRPRRRHCSGPASRASSAAASSSTAATCCGSAHPLSPKTSRWSSTVRTLHAHICTCSAHACKRSVHTTAPPVGVGHGERLRTRLRRRDGVAGHGRTRQPPARRSARAHAWSGRRHHCCRHHAGMCSPAWPRPWPSLLP